MLRLTGSHEGRRFVLPIGPRPVRVGREAAEVEIPLELPGVSRRHARIERSERGVLVTDLGSKNGLWSAGTRHTRIELQPGDQVRIGVLWLTLEEVSTADHEWIPLGGTATGPLTLTEVESRLTESFAPMAGVLRSLSRLASSSGEAAALDELRAALGLESLAVFRRSLGGAWRLDVASGPVPTDPWPEASRPKGNYQVVGTTAAVVARSSTLASDRLGVAEVLATALAVVERPGTEAIEAPPQSRRDGLVLPPGFLLGSAPAAQRMLTELAAAVRSGLHVLLRGESGVGKEFVARLVHASGSNANGPFVPLNCAAIPSSLFESQVFGIEPRVATGVEGRPGLLQQAVGGTVFLDEVGDLPLDQQAKLLRALQEKVIQSVGGRPEGRAVQFRVVSATNRELAGDLSEGRFRTDLYYRLAGFVVRIPPLRERREDIPALAAHFARQAARFQKQPLAGISKKSLERLVALDWPGNVRQLQSVLARAVSYVDHGDALESIHLERALEGSEPTLDRSLGGPNQTDARTMAERVAACQRASALEALAVEQGNQTRAAARLGMTRNGFLALCKRLGLTDE